MPSYYRDVDPRELRVPPCRPGGADLIKLQRQIARFGASSQGMPPLIAYEGTDGVLVLYNGVTRATSDRQACSRHSGPSRGDRPASAGLWACPQDRRPSPMIPSTQREALTVLAELAELSPDVRLGQLLAHLGFLSQDQTGRSLWDIDDEQFLAVLYHHRAELVERQATPRSGLQPSERAG